MMNASSRLTLMLPKEEVTTTITTTATTTPPRNEFGTSASKQKKNASPKAVDEFVVEKAHQLGSHFSKAIHTWSEMANEYLLYKDDNHDGNHDDDEQQDNADADHQRQQQHFVKSKNRRRSGLNRSKQRIVHSFSTESSSVKSPPSFVSSSRVSATSSVTGPFDEHDELIRLQQQQQQTDSDALSPHMLLSHQQQHHHQQSVAAAAAAAADTTVGVHHSATPIARMRHRNIAEAATLAPSPTPRSKLSKEQQIKERQKRWRRHCMQLVKEGGGDGGSPGDDNDDDGDNGGVGTRRKGNLLDEHYAKSTTSRPSTSTPTSFLLLKNNKSNSKNKKKGKKKSRSKSNSNIVCGDGGATAADIRTISERFRSLSNSNNKTKSTDILCNTRFLDDSFMRQFLKQQCGAIDDSLSLMSEDDDDDDFYSSDPSEENASSSPRRNEGPKTKTTSNKSNRLEAPQQQRQQKEIKGKNLKHKQKKQEKVVEKEEQETTKTKQPGETREMEEVLSVASPDGDVASCVASSAAVVSSTEKQQHTKATPKQVMDIERESDLKTTDLRDKNFVKVFISEVSQEGYPLIWHKPSLDGAKDIDQPIEVLAFLERGFLQEDDEMAGPRLAWYSRVGNPLGAIDLFDIKSVNKADPLQLVEFPFAIPGKSMIMRLHNAFDELIMEASSAEDAQLFIHGLRWVVARLAFNLIIGNRDVSCELMEILETGPREYANAQAMNDITNQLVDKAVFCSPQYKPM